MRFISYAQEYEDMFIYITLRDYVKVGNYIDVGANDPVMYSVTKAFYDMGWSGINVEPLPDMCALLEEARPRDINLCLGCGAHESTMNLRVAGMGSTFAPEVAENYKEGADISCKVLPLQSIYDRYCSPDMEIHFCKIDVEGFEGEVLKGIDFQRFRPWLMVMESTEPGTTIFCYEQWEPILLRNGYQFAFGNGINRYYVAEEKSFLKDKHLGIADYFKAGNELLKVTGQNVFFNQ